MRNMKNNILKKEAFSIIIPVMLQGIMVSLVGASDTIMLGVLSEEAMSAASLANEITTVHFLFIYGAVTALGVLIAQYIGKGDKKNIEKIIPICLRYSLIVGIIFALLCIFTPGLLMGFYTNDAILVENGSRYLVYMGMTYVFYGLSQVYISIFRNTNRVKTATIITSCCVVINIIMNYLLIFGVLFIPNMGIEGAALATTISRAIELIICIIVNKKYKEINVKWKYIIKRYKDKKEIEIYKVLKIDFLKTSVPLIIASIIWGFAFTLYSVIIGHLGRGAVSSYAITNVFKNLFSCMVRGVASAAGIMTGKILGTGNMKKAKECASYLLKLSIIIGGISGGILIVFSPLISYFVNISSEAKSYLVWMIIIMGVNLFAQSINMTLLDGILFAGGASKYDMYGNIGAMWCFAIPLGFLGGFVFHWPIIIVFLIIKLDEIVKLPFIIKWYKNGVWLRDLTRDFV